MTNRAGWTTLLAVLVMAGSVGAARESSDALAGFVPSGWPGEVMRQSVTAQGIRSVTLAPDRIDSNKPSVHIIYATPNGNTIEQTLGRGMTPGMDWHFDIQHVAAQVRMYRAAARGRNVFVTVTEAPGLSWPAFRSKTPDANSLIRDFVTGLVSTTPGPNASAILSGHSGGGSFLFGFIESSPDIPGWVERVVFLDANYAFSVEKGHGSTLLAWLDGDASRRLVVFAYDDRDVKLDGKKIVSSTGGTYRSTERMVGFFEKHGAIKSGRQGEFIDRSWRGGQAEFLIHPNPDLKILHTAMIGEMNALLYSLSTGTDLEPKLGRLGAPRSYSRYVEKPRLPAAPAIPARPASARAGLELMEQCQNMPREAREELLLSELLSGNIPAPSRRFNTVKLTEQCSDGKVHEIELQVLADYLMIGSDADRVRACVNPYTAQSAADAFGCLLPTAKLVDAIWKQSEVKVEPLPLTAERESPATFAAHSRQIDSQLPKGRPAGYLTAGMKKDLVITNLLSQRPNRVAIYGWHKLDGSPIQPLTTVHVDWYVDYSHGTRLVARRCVVDGQPADLADILTSPVLSKLVSDEGTIKPPRYEAKTKPASQ